MGYYKKKPAKTVEITARFDWERFCFQDGTPSRCIIGQATIENSETITIKGECQPNDLRAGITYRFDGEWITHPKYGKQFSFHSFCQPSPVTPDAIQDYLATCPNIGEMRARKIYVTLGADCIKQIKADPNVLTKIKGINSEKAIEIQKSLLEREDQENLTIELKSMLGGFGLPKRIYKNLKETYGTAAPKAIKENPYLLMEYKGVGFLKADEVFLSLGNSSDDILRQKYAMQYIVSSDSSGSIWIPQSEVFKKLRDMLDSDLDDPAIAGELAIVGGLLSETENEGKKYFGLPRFDDAEQWVAEWLSNRIDTKSNFPTDLFFENDIPSEHQLQEYKNATKSSVGILAGSPGTGKTWLVARIVETIQKDPKETVFVCAPTGKAALRVTESLKAQGVSISATTIHSLLCAQSDESGGWRFRYGDMEKLPCTFLIIDESSMIDIMLLMQLLVAVSDNCSVLFVGDPDQLSPVGRGAPLRDMIVAGIPCGRLTAIRRNSGEIVTACSQIRENKPIDCIGEYDGDKNLIMSDTEQSIEGMMKMVDMIWDYEEGINIMDFQIIVPINDKSPVARNKFNPVLQDYFNAQSDIHVTETKIKKFRINDKVICLTNGVAEHANSSERQVRVANGDIGIIEEILKEKFIVSVNNEMVIVPMFSDSWGETDWDLGYAISGHKSQGSEWKVVIVVLDSSFAAGMICDKHWLYTAISRAKKRCYLLGNKNSVTSMAKISKMWNRKTLLKERFLNFKFSFLNDQFSNLLQENKNE